MSNPYEEVFFGFCPSTFCDTIHTAVDDYINEGIDSLEATLMATVAVSTSDRTALKVCNDKFTTALRMMYDRNIDKFEIYAQRNVFRIPKSCEAAIAREYTARCGDSIASRTSSSSQKGRKEGDDENIKRLKVSDTSFSPSKSKAYASSSSSQQSSSSSSSPSKSETKALIDGAILYNDNRSSISYPSPVLPAIIATVPASRKDIPFDFETEALDEELTVLRKKARAVKRRSYALKAAIKKMEIQCLKADKNGEFDTMFNTFLAPLHETVKDVVQSKSGLDDLKDEGVALAKKLSKIEEHEEKKNGGGEGINGSSSSSGANSTNKRPLTLKDKFAAARKQISTRSASDISNLTALLRKR
jgi:hypothetical protein